MRSLRRSVALAALAAVGAAPTGASAASGPRFVTGAPCSLTGVAATAPGSYSGALNCFAWLDAVAASDSRTAIAGQACGTVQVGSADPNGPFGGAATTCVAGSPAWANSGVVSYAAAPGDAIYLCTYVLGGDGHTFAYDADRDARNGDQCATVHTNRDGTVSACPTGLCLAVVDDRTDAALATVRDGAAPIGEALRPVRQAIADLADIDPVDPLDPDPWCAGCLSGFDPVVDDVYEAVLSVDLSA